MDQIHPKKCEQNLALTGISEESKISSQTPQKRDDPLRTDAKAKLPEKYKMIADLFNRMIISLSLLNLRKKPPTFQNVSAQVEVLAKREFLYKHLGQIKYLLPEAVEIDKILVHDKKTPCMRPDLKITLRMDVVDARAEQSGVMALEELFASRLEDFVSTYPEASDVPQATLPAAFNEIRHKDTCEITPEDFVGLSQQNSSGIGDAVEPSMALKSPSKEFLPEIFISKLENSKSLKSQRPFPSSMFDQGSQSSQQKEMTCLSGADVVEKTVNTEPQEESLDDCSGATAAVPSFKLITSHSSIVSMACESPAVKDSSSTESVLIETPAQLTPKRSVAPDSDSKDLTNIEACMSCHKPAKRSLNFSSFNCEGSDSSSIYELESCEHAVLGKPHSTSLFQKGNRNLDKDKVMQTSSGICQEMLSSLPGTVSVIDDIFKAVSRSSITKEELVHKIIFNNYDIVERREVEEQVELLERLVPDWICQNPTPSGDVMYSIKRVLDIESVLSRLIST